MPLPQFGARPHQGVGEPGFAQHGREDARQQPGRHHEHDDGARHPAQSRRAVVGGPLGEQEAGAQCYDQDGPQAALVRRAGKAQPGGAGCEDEDRERCSRQAQPEGERLLWMVGHTV